MKRPLLKFFNIYIIKRESHSCGSLVRVGSVEFWRKVDGGIFQFFSSCVHTEGRGELLLAVKLHKHFGMGNSHRMIP